MASSEKTEVLQLSLWGPGDRPERLDFRGDNERLEETVGGHLSDTVRHLTVREKDFLAHPIYVENIVGTGYSSLSKTGLPSDVDLVLVFCAERPASIAGSGGKTEVYWDYWCRSPAEVPKGYFGGGSVIVDPNTGRITLQNIEIGDMVYRMNENNCHYVVLGLRKTMGFT